MSIFQQLSTLLRSRQPVKKETDFWNNRIAQAVMATVPGTKQFNTNAVNFGRAVSPAVRPFVQTVGKGIAAQTNAQAYFNPLISKAHKQQYFPKPTNADVVTALKGNLAQMGAVAAPGLSAVGGLFNTGINTVGNAIQRKPLLSNTAESFGQGFTGSAMAGPLVGATNPFISKALGPIAGKLTSRLAGAGANVAQGIGVNVASGNPAFSNIGPDALVGLVGGKRQFGNAGVETIKIPQADKEAIYTLADQVRRKATRNGEVTRNIEILMDRYLGKSWIDKNGYDLKKASSALMDIADKNYSRAYQTVWGLTDDAPQNRGNGFITPDGKYLDADTHAEAAYKQFKGSIGNKDEALTELMTRGVDPRGGYVRTVIKPNEANFEMVGKPTAQQIESMV
jgi:hypothetical protein